MMKPRLSFCIALLLSLASGAPSGGAGRASPVGVWVTEGGWSHIEVYSCSGNLCGRIVWLKEPLDKNGKIKVDGENPDPAKRRQTLVGLTMMWNFARTADPGEWDGGRIYNPLDGETYRARLRLLADGKLELRGYVLIPLFGGSQHWERVR